MPRPNGPVSLAELAAAGVRLRPFEAVTIAREVALQVVRGQIAGVPSAHVVRLSGNGTVSIEGPVAAGGRPVVRVAQLLDGLLPEGEAGSEFKVPGGLKLVVARALGTLDVPPYGSLEAFVESLDRFAATDPAAAITNLVVSCAESTASRPAQTPAQVLPVVAAQVQPFVPARAGESRSTQPSEPLTISDIRRARRATGVPLVKVAERSRIPLGLLRQLEWGYFFNWPAGRYGRSQLVRYARAAGLDEELVLSTVTPLIEQAATVAPAATVLRGEASPAPAPAAAPEALILRPPAALDLRVSPAATFLVPDVANQVEAPRRRRGGLVAALAAAAAVTIMVPMWWEYADRPAAPPMDVSQAATGTTGTEPAGGATTPVNAPDTGRASTAAATPAAEPSAAAAASAARRQPDALHPATPPAGPSGEYQLAADRTAYSPAFASVGTAVFFHDGDGRASKSDLLRAETDGEGALLRITSIVNDSANNAHVRPSPDETRIAFDSDRDGERGVYVADADGKNVRRVSGEGWAAVPTWSPDGRTLAFVRHEPGREKVWNLWTLQLETGESRQITNYGYGAPWGGSWFPDGRRIAYSHEERLIVRDLETGAERIIPTPIKGVQVRTPAVSPDGRRIVFQVFRKGTWLLELPSGSVRKILEDPTAEEYTWAPDGKRFAYHSRQSGKGTWGVWVMASR